MSSLNSFSPSSDSIALSTVKVSSAISRYFHLPAARFADSLRNGVINRKIKDKFPPAGREPNLTGVKIVSRSFSLSATARPHNFTLRSRSFTSLRHFVCPVERPVAVNIIRRETLFKTSVRTRRTLSSQLVPNGLCRATLVVNQTLMQAQ